MFGKKYAQVLSLLSSVSGGSKGDTITETITAVGRYILHRNIGACFSLTNVF